MHDRPFGEFVGLDHLSEAFAAHEVVVFTLYLVLARLTRGVRDGKAQIELSGQPSCQRGLAGTRG